jgi:hypothetical protein
MNTDGEKEVLSPRRQGAKARRKRKRGVLCGLGCLEAKPGERMGFFDRINRMGRGWGCAGGESILVPNPNRNPNRYRHRAAGEIAIF